MTTLLFLVRVFLTFILVEGFSMGIRFACHVCEKRLHIKEELAGRRGICPNCSTRFRIPQQDAETSVPLITQPVTKLVAEAPRQPAQIAQSPDRSLQSSAMGTSVSEAVTEGSPAIAEPSPNASAESLEGDPPATWYVRPPSGGQYGPASKAVLQQWIGEGRVASSALLWRDGWPHWRDAGEVLPELASQLPQPEVGHPVSALGRQGAEGEAAIESPVGLQDRGVGHEVSTATPATFSGQPNVAASRRARSLRRVMLIGVLMAVAVTLVGVLIVVINR